MKPTIICHMLGSIDGSLHPSRYTASPDGGTDDWSTAYDAIHDALNGDAWMVGRVTMAEMSKAGPHAPPEPGHVERPVHVARHASTYAVALDPSGKLHFDGGEVSGGHVIVLLGPDASDAHLAELAADGVSYVVAEGDTLQLDSMMETLGERFGIRRLLLEGGGHINASFLAAGLVDELSVLIAPALDARIDTHGIVAVEGGLAGKLRLRLSGADMLDHGLVHLRYRVLPAHDDG